MVPGLLFPIPTQQEQDPEQTVSMAEEQARGKAQNLFSAILTALYKNANQSQVGSGAPVQQRGTQQQAQQQQQGQGQAQPVGRAQQLQQANEDEILKRLAALESQNIDLKPPQMAQTGIDSPEERQILAVIQAATGDTGLVGAVAKAMVDEETRKAAIDFQNAVLNYEAEKLRLQMSRETSMLGIQTLAALGRDRLNALMSDIQSDQFERGFALEERMTDARIKAMEAEQRARIFQELQPFIQAYTSPTLSDEEAAVFEQKLVESGMFTPEQASALRKTGVNGAKAAAAAEKIINLHGVYGQELQTLLRSGMVPEGGFYDNHDQRIRAAWNELPEDTQALVRQLFPFAAFLGENGIQAPEASLPPAQIDPADLGLVEAQQFQDGFFKTDTFSKDIVAGFTRTSIRGQKELRSWLEGFLDNLSGGGAPSLVVNVMRGNEITSFSPTERAKLTNLGQDLLGDPGKLAMVWIQGKVGSNPFQTFVDPKTGLVWNLSPDQTAEGWARLMESKKEDGKVVPFTIKVNGRDVPVVPLVQYIVRQSNAGGRVTMVYDEERGQWVATVSGGVGGGGGESDRKKNAAILRNLIEKQGSK